MILGPSGCGKSTLLNIISGIDRNYEGQVINNENLEYITQESNFYEEMTIYENCSIISSNKANIDEYLRLFNLYDHKNRKIKKCSNGQRKRVQFIRALLKKPNILLCDEPTASLDFNNSKLIMDIIKKISNEMIIIMVTHDIALSKKYADRIITMGKASIIKDEVINQKEKINLNENQSKKSILKHLKLLRYKIKSRCLESAFMILLTFMMVFSMIAGIQLNQNVNNQVSNNKIWQNSLNIVQAQFLDKYLYKKNEFSTPYYTEFDLFYESEINKIVNDNFEIIAVNAGFINVDRIKNSFYQGKYMLEEWQENIFKINLYDPYYFNEFVYSSEPGGPELLISQSIKEEEINNQVQKILNNERNSCQYAENMGSEEACLAYFYDNSVFYDAYAEDANSYNRNLSIYEIIDESKFPIMLGELPNQENEILLGKNTAEVIIKKYGFENLETLIDQEIEIAIPNSGAILAGPPYEFLEFKTLKITGITSYESDYQNQIFFARGCKKSSLYANLLINEDVDLYYTHLEFLIDPSIDFVNVVNKLNQSSIYDYSEFVLFNETEILEVDYLYRDSSVFKIYSFVLIATIFIIYTSYYLFTKSRRQKEGYLVKNYNYNTFVDCMLYSLFISLISLICYLLFGNGLFNYINELVKMFKFNNILNFNPIQCIQLHLIIWIMLSIIEILIRRKKYDSN